MKRTFLFSLALLATFYTYCQEIKGSYAIRNAETGIFIRIKDANTKNGTPIVTYSPVNWKCVTWDFKKQEANKYLLENLFSHKTMQPVSPAKQGVALEEQPLQKNSPQQLYEFIADGNNNYLIKLSGTELYITPSVNTGEVNAPIILLPKSGSRLQLWQLIEQHPTM
ncbi:MAG: RICIN domain-containing protein [Niastella sp.]|nr:RICIN domain-containing protein [Niastella sp.]